MAIMMKTKNWPLYLTIKKLLLPETQQELLLGNDGDENLIGMSLKDNGKKKKKKKKQNKTKQKNT